MKSRILFNSFFAVMATIALSVTSCHNDEPLSEMPYKISQFVTQYFPNMGVSSFTESSDTYHVRLDNGPGLTFDKSYGWEVVNGYGMPLPQVLLFDQLPPALYSYLDETQTLDAVFTIERNSTTYTVVLLDSTLSYDIASGEITGSDRKV